MISITFIKKLSLYAYYHLNRTKLDQIYIENILIELLHVENMSLERINKDQLKQMKVPDLLKEEFFSLLGKKDEELWNQIMGLLTPSPELFIHNFNKRRMKYGIDNAIDYFHQLMIFNDYIKKTFIEKNIIWKTKRAYPIEFNINLAKPEKVQNKITNIENSYPNCEICIENLGYKTKENLRILPLILNNESWFMQFSPYAYIPYHVIIINGKHTRMNINKNTFIRLCDFIDQFPSFFIGSNSDLPLIGGSILSHEHYQGGKYIFPMMKCPNKYTLINNSSLKIGYLDWYNSVIHIESEDRKLLIDACIKIFDAWKQYENQELEIIPYENKIRHNSITPVMQKKHHTYHGYLILRNNRTNNQYKEGIFAAHKKYHFIKKEGIGLMEMMGFFVLPGRLQKEFLKIINFYQNPTKNIDEFIKKNDDMIPYLPFIETLMNHYSKNLSIESLKWFIKETIEYCTEQILRNTCIFKDDEKGNKAFQAFLSSISF